MSSIHDNIDNAFLQHRILFWYDEGEKLKNDFESYHKDDVEKIVVRNNQFFVKHRLLSEQSQRFLLYFDMAEPDYEENWLLDMQLAHQVLSSDIESMYLQDLGLEYHFKPLIKEYFAFFENKNRRYKLKEQLATDDNDRDIVYKMWGVVFDVDYINLETFIQAYAQAFYDESSRIESDLLRYNLQSLFWKEVGAKFN